MFWFDKNNKNTVYMDKREFEDVLCDGRELKVNPDVVGDFRKIPYPDDKFHLVVFDPPHLVRAGEKSWIAKKYGKLNPETWKSRRKFVVGQKIRQVEIGHMGRRHKARI